MKRAKQRIPMHRHAWKLAKVKREIRRANMMAARLDRKYGKDYLKRMLLADL